MILEAAPYELANDEANVTIKELVIVVIEDDAETSTACWFAVAVAFKIEGKFMNCLVEAI